MNILRRTGNVAYEDLMRELEQIEHELLQENGTLAMNLMVLETKLRERFQQMEMRLLERLPMDEAPEADDDFTLEEIQALIPQDLPIFPPMSELQGNRKRKKTLNMVVMAAALAVVTALGVFGLAAIVHMTLAWIA